MLTATDLIAPYTIKNGRKFRLKDFDPKDTGKARLKNRAKELIKHGVEWIAEQQGMLYAQDRWSLLLIFQAMDAAGKDGAIRHVMSGVNPQGVQVFSFKAPSAEELDHDFLWRHVSRLPERGRIGIHNRSWYEETLVARVHPEILGKQHLPKPLVTDDIWQQRFEDIRNFEKYLSRNGTIIRKFFLYVSPEEQKKRFLERLREPDKNWKYSPADVAERNHWKTYMHAYEETIRNTASKHAPWYVVPADNKWYTRLVVGAVIVDTIRTLKLSYPEANESVRKSLDAARKMLENE